MNDVSGKPSTALVGRTFSVFRNRPFLLFWIGACVSNIGNWTENAAQSWAVTSQTAGTAHQAFYVEVLQFADFCPVLLLALVAGVISDRVNRRTWLIILQTSAGILGAMLAIAAYLGRATPVVVIVFTFLEGIVWALNGPVFQAVVPSLVPRDELQKAIALNSVQFNTARLCGPMLAAAIIGVAGIAGAFTFNSLTFLPLLVVLLFFIPSIPRPVEARKLSLGQEIREGLNFVWNNPGTKRLSIMGLVFMFLSAPLQGLLPVFAQTVLKGGPQLFGMMLSMIGLGSILGAFALSYIPAYYPRHHLIPLAMSAFAVIGLAFSFSTIPALSLIILVGSGVSWLLSLNPSNTANQLLATDANRGRVISVMLLAQQGGTPLGHLFAGFLSHYMSPQWTLRVMLGTLLIVMPFFLFRREPGIDSMPRRHLGKLSLRDAIWEAITAASHRPGTPGDVGVESNRERP